MLSMSPMGIPELSVKKWAEALTSIHVIEEFEFGKVVCLLRKDIKGWTEDKAYEDLACSTQRLYLPLFTLFTFICKRNEFKSF